MLNSGSAQGRQKTCKIGSAKTSRHPDPPLGVSQRQNIFGTISKSIPRNIMQDKEQLYEESLSLKKSMNALRTENTKLKTQLLKSEQELVKKDKEIKALLFHLNTPKQILLKKQPKSNTHLILNLKKRITEVQKENKVLKKALAGFKKSLKTTRAQELENEIKNYAEECIRLRNMLERISSEKPYTSLEGVKRMENEMKAQVELINKLRQENSDLAGRVRRAAEESDKWRASKVSSDSTREVKRLKEQLELTKRMNRSHKQVEELRKSKEDFETLSEEQEKRIRSLEKRLEKCRKVRNEEGKVVEVVGKEEAALIGVELKLNLILANAASGELRERLFKNCNDNEKISIHELARILMRSPTSLKSETATKASRYLIEPRGSKEVAYNELLEAKLSAIVQSLHQLVGPYTLNYNERKEAIQTSLLEKLNDKLESFANALQRHTDENGNLNPKHLQKIYEGLELHLTNDEADYVLLAMYATSKDLSKLHYEDLLESLNELLTALLTREANPEAKAEEREEDRGGQSIGSTPRKLDESMSEDQKLAVLEQLLTEVAGKLKDRRTTLEELLKSKTYKKVVDGEEVELVLHKDFALAMESLELKGFGAKERVCLEKLLRPEDVADSFRVKDLTLILDDFLAPKDPNDLSKEMKFEELNKISMVLLLALSEYLSNEDMEVGDLFKDTVYKQLIQIDDEEFQLDVINSPDFFEVISKVGIETNEADHDNLKAFLAIDLNYTTKLSLDKIKAAIKEFSSNEELRNKAHKHYKELLKDNQVQEEINRDESEDEAANNSADIHNISL